LPPVAACACPAVQGVKVSSNARLDLGEVGSIMELAQASFAKARHHMERAVRLVERAEILERPLREDASASKALEAPG